MLYQCFTMITNDSLYRSSEVEKNYLYLSAVVVIALIFIKRA
jgi:hypothetical protein